MKFRLERQFPETSDFTKNRWFHGYQATKELMVNYGFELEQPWKRNVPSLLFQFGALQHFIPQEQAIDSKLFSNGEFDFKLGQQINPAVQDLFTTTGNSLPIAPSMVIDPKKLDGTTAPSYEAAEKPAGKMNPDNVLNDDEIHQW